MDREIKLVLVTDGNVTCTMDREIKLVLHVYACSY